MSLNDLAKELKVNGSESKFYGISLAMIFCIDDAIFTDDELFDL